MGYRQFEELPVWNAAIELAVQVFSLAGTGCLGRYAGLRSQIERAALSISNNIAEGFGRGSHEELVAFLYVARGSTTEVQSMLSLIRRLPGIDDVHESLSRIRGMADDVLHQINRWLSALKESPRKGPRFETSHDRDLAARSRRAEEAAERLRRIVEEHRNPKAQEP